MTPTRVLVADPPWRFGDHLPGPKRGSSKHYATLSLPEVAGFPLPPMLADSYLLLWRVAAMQEEALAVVRAWGFVPKGEIVWVKQNRAGGLRIGMGHHFRGAHETCIVATRGAPKRHRLSRALPSVIFAPRGEHSAKPEAFYRLVEKFVGGPYTELFARRERDGWTCFGDEIEVAEPNTSTSQPTRSTLSPQRDGSLSPRSESAAARSKSSSCESPTRA